jgi:flavin-dependent dehydrogenase
MSKSRSQPDVVVLGSHPCCYLAGALLQAEKVKVVVATIPGQSAPDRLVVINPKFFDLHKYCAALKKLSCLVPENGLKFLADDSNTWSEYVAKGVVAYIAPFSVIREALLDQCKKAKLDVREAKTLEIHGADENGVSLSIDGERMHPKMLIDGGELSPAHRKILGLPKSWDAGVLHRYTYLHIKGTKCVDGEAQKLIPMSLDLAGHLHWAWMLCGQDSVQVSVEQPIESTNAEPPKDLLAKWIDVLIKHRHLKPGPKPFDVSNAQWLDIPFAGALAQEGVANRTLLIGPAGGFYNACAEDLYPCCWSALFAASVAVKALQARHLQDALNAYRETWGATLGDYLRGPQENLRFLLPLVYRNSVMTARMGEAILSGESVVR